MDEYSGGPRAVILGKRFQTVYYQLTLRGYECRICQAPMLNFRETNATGYNEHDLLFQMRELGIIQESQFRVDDYPVCVNCAKAGRIDFKCALCLKRKSSEKIRRTIGDPPEYLCTDCFTTVTAKVWDEKEDELLDKHRYDGAS